MEKKTLGETRLSRGASSKVIHTQVSGNKKICLDSLECFDSYELLVNLSDGLHTLVAHTKHSTHMHLKANSHRTDKRQQTPTN